MEVLIRLLRHTPPPGSAGQESQLHEVRLVNVLQRHGLLSDGGRQSLQPHGRMIEIYVVTALGPIPLATMGSSEWRSTGQNYLKSLLALGFQAFLIMIVVGIYAVLIRNISGAADIAGAIWGCMGYTVLLCFCLFKTGSISKSVFGAH